MYIPFAFRNNARGLGLFEESFFGEGDSENGQWLIWTLLIDRQIVHGIKRPNFRQKSITPIRLSFGVVIRGKFIAYAVFMLDNFIVSKSSSFPPSLSLSRAAVNEGFNWFYDCKVEESFFLFLSFSFFLFHFFSLPPPFLLFGFLLVFLFLIPPRIKFL